MISKAWSISDFRWRKTKFLNAILMYHLMTAINPDAFFFFLQKRKYHYLIFNMIPQFVIEVTSMHFPVLGT